MECKKVKFATEKDCDEYLKRLKKTSTREVKPIRSYMCQHCNAWHLTSRETFESIKIKELTAKIAELNAKINLLEGKNNKELNKDLKRDERIIELNKHIMSQKETIHKLRKSNSDLICENVQLIQKMKPQSA